MKGCFGCFSLIQTIISTIVISCLAFVVLFPCGGLEYIKTYIDAKLHPTKAAIQEKAQEYGDFSKIPKEYELIRAVNMFGANAIVAEHTKTNQKMAIVDPGPILKLTKSDINATTVNTELKKLATRFNSFPVKLSNIELGKTGIFKAFDQDIPYIQMKISLTGNVNQNIEGIIGVINDPDSKNKLIISGNEFDKYNQKITESYFKKIKLKAHSGE